MSLLINYMPPRITRKSYRPRASDRTMVDTIRPRSLSCFRIRMRRHDNQMNLQPDKSPGGSQHDMGWRTRRTSSLLPVARGSFSLDSPLYRTLVLTGVWSLSGWEQLGSNSRSLPFRSWIGVEKSAYHHLSQNATLRSES
jgi:hypothetical protein